MQLHSRTPILAVTDSRGLAVRAVAYYRSEVQYAPQPRINRHAYDAAGRPLASWDPRLWASFELERKTPANQASILSLSGQILRSDSVDAGFVTTVFGAAGEVRETRDSRETVRRVHHDSMMRPIMLTESTADDAELVAERVTYADGDTDAATHNRCGQLMRQDDNTGTRHVHEYGVLTQPLRETRHFLKTLESPDWPAEVAARDALLEPGAGATTTWAFDALGDPVSQTDAKGNQQVFGQTVDGQLCKSTLQLKGQSAFQTLVHSIVYNAGGQVESETAGNGVTTRNTFAADGHLINLTARKADGSCLQNLSYAYDPVGNVIQIIDALQPLLHFHNTITDGTSSYSYDTLYQLIEATGRENLTAVIGPGLPDLPLPGGGDHSLLVPYRQSYGYDAGGNLTTLTHQGAQHYRRILTIAAHSNRGLANDGSEAPDFSNGFDGNGNLQQLQRGQTLHWDRRNQLSRVVQVTRENAVNDDECYTYDGSGQRVRKTRVWSTGRRQHTAEVRYLPGVEIRTNTANGTTLQVISAAAGRNQVQVLHWESEPPEGLTNDQYRYSLSDHLGSSAVELDEHAQLMGQEGYYPFGGTAWQAARSAVEASYKTLRYSGKERDATGLYYYGFRYYAPWLQRWINPDPAGGVDGLNLYRMVRNNPMVLRDDNGLAPINILNPSAEHRKLAKIDKLEVSPMQELYKRGVTGKPVPYTEEVKDRVWDRLEAANLANRFTQALIPYGAGNQIVDLWETRLGSLKKVSELRAGVTDLPTPALMKKAINLGAGNCGDYAYIAFSLLASTERKSPVSYVQAEGIDHQFVVIGDTRAESTRKVVVVDPWVTFPMPHPLDFGAFAISKILEEANVGPGDPKYNLEFPQTPHPAYKPTINKKTDKETIDFINDPKNNNFQQFFSLKHDQLEVTYTHSGKTSARHSYSTKNRADRKISSYKAWAKATP